MAYNILAISGGTRKGSYNTMLVEAVKALAPEGVEVEIVNIGHLPMYNQDLEAEFPSSVMEIKEKMKAADAIIIATPEYNRSIPTALKNVIDWTSRPYGQGSWAGKVVFPMGASMGPLGTVSAQADLRKILIHLNAIVLGQPEFYVGSAHEKFGEDGTLTDETTQNFIGAALTTLTAFIDKVK